MEKERRTWKEILAEGIASAILKAASRRGIYVETKLNGNAKFSKEDGVTVVSYDTTVTHKVKVDHGE